MRAVRLIAILWVVLFALGVSVARAGVISSTSDPVGPGCPAPPQGCGASDFTNGAGGVNNDDFTGTGTDNPNSFSLTEDFRSINYIDVVFTINSSGGITEYFSTNFAINNVTGVDWTGFRWSLIPAVALDELDFDFDMFNPAPTSDVFASVNFTESEDRLTYSNGTLTPNHTATFYFSLDVPDTYCTGVPVTCSSFTIRGEPLTAASEPSALLLLGSGLAGLGLWRRWHS
jgi:hypothetical protein